MFEFCFYHIQAHCEECAIQDSLVEPMTLENGIETFSSIKWTGLWVGSVHENNMGAILRGVCPMCSREKSAT